MQENFLPFEDRINVRFCQVFVAQVAIGGKNVVEECQRGDIRKGSGTDGWKEDSGPIESVERHRASEFVQRPPERPKNNYGDSNGDF